MYIYINIYHLLILFKMKLWLLGWNLKIKTKLRNVGSRIILFKFDIYNIKKLEILFWSYRVITVTISKITKGIHL